jgi:hypothetical protein
MRCDNRVSNMKASMSFLRLLQFFAVNRAIDNHVDPAYNNLPSFLEGFRVGRIRKLVDQLTTLYALTGYMAKNASHVGNASAITMQDGREMFAASSIAN